MLTTRVLDRLRQVFSGLNTNITLLDTLGNSLIPAEDIRFSLPLLTQQGAPVTWEGRLYHWCAASRDLVLMSPEQASPQMEDALRLCDQVIASLLLAESASSDVHSCWQRILENQMSPSELAAAADEYRIPVHAPRCALILYLVQVQASSAREILDEVVPKGNGDVLVSMDRHTAVLVKDTQGLEGVEDLRQFAQALQETLVGETGLGMSVGIGEVFQELSDLHQSYRQARHAIEIGSQFAARDGVYIYKSMLLERFLSDLSPETAAHYHSLLFNRSTSRLFTDEMLETLEMFFKKDLNLSDTARQMYIHRNTLVYRLDKVQRQVGLDLRRFDDAVTFKLLYEMRKCAGNRGSTGKKHG